MSEKRHIVFVCTGNICRSAMAEHLLRHWTAQRGLALETSSCGIAAERWYTVPEGAHKMLRAEGVPPITHQARLATRETLRAGHVILAMTQAHHDHIIDRYPEFSSRTFLFREFAGFGEEDVADPMGLPDEAFARCMAVLKESLEALLRQGKL